MESETPTPTTTITTTTTKLPEIRIETSYVYTVGGILKMLQVLLNLVGFILIEASGEKAELSKAEYYCFVSMTGLCISSILLLLYLLRIIQATNKIPWFKIELIYCILWIMFGVIAGLLTIHEPHFETAAYFAFAAVGCYALEAFYKICSITIRSV